MEVNQGTCKSRGGGEKKSFGGAMGSGAVGGIMGCMAMELGWWLAAQLDIVGAVGGTILGPWEYRATV